MASWTPRLPWSVIRPGNKTESQEVDCNFFDRTADGFLFQQNPNILNCQKSRIPDEPQSISPENGVLGQENVRKHTLKIDWKQGNQLVERKRREEYGIPRGFEPMRVFNLSWKRWRRRRQNSEGGDDQINEFSSETTPTFEVFASAKPLCDAPKICQEMKKPSYPSNTRPRALKQVVRTWSISKTEGVSCVSRESTGDTPSDESIASESIEDAPRDELKTLATLDKAPNFSSLENNSLYPARILKWLKENHQVLDDLLTRIDKSGRGGLSYEEFVQELEDMGAPGSQDELYNMAFALDTNEDHSINYQELKKLKRRFRASSFVNNNEFMNQRNEVLPVLQPCSKCKLGLFEPTTRSRIRRFISLVLKNFIIKGTQKNSLIGQFTFDVGPDISIYGIQRMVKAELGGSAIGVRIIRGNRKVEVLDHMKTLEDYGYRGSTVLDRPEVVELFYDYDYPRLDCPLLLANTSM